ncbi:hypothetical protein LB505_007707 [Fusarium chuoi]|nr:hypothetical protein LB505_007707 [Fusarium chuoi]
MGKMKAARTTRRHTPLSNAGTRSSNRIAAKKETKGTKQAGPSQKKVLSAPHEPELDMLSFPHLRPDTYSIPLAAATQLGRSREP